MNDREILASTLRWHTTHQRRLAASAKLYEDKKAAKQSTGHFYSSDCGLSLKVSEAKRVERAALRALAKVCANVRGNQLLVCDAEVVELPALMTPPRLRQIDSVRCRGGRQRR
jgi:hypothetical protein